jgi:hypothetical protein
MFEMIILKVVRNIDRVKVTWLAILVVNGYVAYFSYFNPTSIYEHKV